ncbi:Heme A synthase [Magnetospirillum gryphiswaldense MSR-1 v2]|uniref:Heme A synthase n=1 Tax=Magnetospirillum gryphiswaldense (strain DSM 6361 / JCM 21280 / NBRC 15271 / MSR-1) TaxID=431944 RepID=V6F605_MAGGM|nr:COX15/CtaA family protein [Magnetospirillum gryphiswaldense]CDK99928.1 Heme A synthase [Magnetospirillum gryphiswaldense MSR-1 v2]
MPKMRDAAAHDLDHPQDRHRRILAAWLLMVAAMVAVMVTLGGLTRLTGSGLSMTQWNPHHILPPLDAGQWQEAFALYRQSPEFRLINTQMDLAGYQSIFWLEYIHRLWGRLIGLAFALPLVWFVWRRMVPAGWLPRLLALLALGGGQGVMGWLMVASGLADRPEVSHFRLAAHLLLALVILAALIWCALALRDHPRQRHRLLFTTLWLVAALTLAAMSWGALVAGLDAGRIHNTFPLMQDGWLPSPPLGNAITDAASVQYVHRVLAITAWACLSLLAAWSWRRHGPRPLLLTGAWVQVQAGLGIATLLHGAPLVLAALHQGGAVVLVALLTWALFSVRR